MDWEAVRELAYVHNVEPLLFRVLSSDGDKRGIPDSLRNGWEQAYFDTFLRNEEYFRILRELLDKSRQAELPLMVLKGPALIGRVYGDPALRPMSDVDMFCTKGDLGRVIRMARDMGCRQRALGEDAAGALHVAMDHPDSGSLVEFHFRAYDSINDPETFMDMAFDTREWLKVGDLICPVLSWEMELVFDLAHLAHHQFDVSLKHLIDIAGLLIFNEKRDWPRTQTLLRNFDLERVFFLTAGFISQEMRLTLPHQRPCLEETDDRHVEFYTSLKQLLALLDHPRLMDIKGTMRGFGVAIRHGKGLWGKLRVIREQIFPYLDVTLYECEMVSVGDIAGFYWRRIFFYFERALTTLTHLQKTPQRPNAPSPAAERAAAKNRVTQKLY